MTRLEIGITHEVKINGDKVWVKLSVADDYDFSDKLGRDMDAAIDALAAKVNAKVIDVIVNTVETVEKFEG
jgi:hypothetical protein